MKTDTIKAVEAELPIEEARAEEVETAPMSDDFALVLLRFFRDLAPGSVCVSSSASASFLTTGPKSYPTRSNAKWSTALHTAGC